MRVVTEGSERGNEWREAAESCVSTVRKMKERRGGEAASERGGSGMKNEEGKERETERVTDGGKEMKETIRLSEGKNADGAWVEEKEEMKENKGEAETGRGEREGGSQLSRRGGNGLGDAGIKMERVGTAQKKRREKRNGR